MMYLGGKCIKCGNNDISVLEFHHGNEDKLFNIGGKINKSWNVLRKELDKCVLLCANCHLKEHRQDLSQGFMDTVLDYHGTTKINEVSDLLDIYKQKIQ